MRHAAGRGPGERGEGALRVVAPVSFRFRSVQAGCISFRRLVRWLEVDWEVDGQIVVQAIIASGRTACPVMQAVCLARRRDSVGRGRTGREAVGETGGWWVVRGADGGAGATRLPTLYHTHVRLSIWDPHPTRVVRR